MNSSRERLAVSARNRSGIARTATIVFAALLSCLPLAAIGQDTSIPPPPSSSPNVLIVGGGPNLEHNQAAIESNVRYVDRLLPNGAKRRILFADGNPKSSNVLCEDAAGKSYYRAAQLPALDGPSSLLAVRAEMKWLSTGPDDNAHPILLYFTGHGSPGRRQNFDNNRYDLWHGDDLTVQRLAAEIETLPKNEPLAIVMVQCFSGAFGNLLFKGGDPDGPVVDRNLCGFFASVAVRPAAGCTPEVNEANYRDFTGYFFAALSGKDRLGRPVTGADYNHDGMIGMDEAFDYTLIHDESIDTPVCTSDVFLRRFVKTPDSGVIQTPFTQIQSWAAPAQRAALDSLSVYLKLGGEGRFDRAYQRFLRTDSQSEDPVDVHTIRFVRLAKSVVLAHLLMSSADETVKARYADLVRAEGANPLGAGSSL